MDESEKVAKDYFVHLGFRTVVYEPDGKVPPDFLADGRIAAAFIARGDTGGSRRMASLNRSTEFPWKGALPGAHFVQHGTQGVDVRSGIDSLAFHLFGRHVR